MIGDRPTTPSESDAEFERVLRDSYIGALLIGMQKAVVSAAGGSRIVSAIRSTANQLEHADLALRLRAASWAVMVAALVALGLQLLQPTPVRSLELLLPVVCASAAGLVLVAAGPLARALADRQS